jgi:predicted ribosomally synthesized peptide with nif11-like leader
MSKENLIKLVKTATDDEQLLEQLQSISSYEEVKNLARQQGLDLGDLSEAEAGRTIKVVTGAITEELSDEELELVAGGAYDLNPNDLSFNIGMPPTSKNRSRGGNSAIVDWLGSLE